MIKDLKDEVEMLVPGGPVNDSGELIAGARLTVISMCFWISVIKALAAFQFKPSSSALVTMISVLGEKRTLVVAPDGGYFSL